MAPKQNRTIKTDRHRVLPLKRELFQPATQRAPLLLSEPVSPLILPLPLSFSDSWLGSTTDSSIKTLSPFAEESNGTKELALHTIPLAAALVQSVVQYIVYSYYFLSYTLYRQWSCQDWPLSTQPRVISENRARHSPKPQITKTSGSRMRGSRAEVYALHVGICGLIPEIHSMAPQS